MPSAARVLCTPSTVQRPGQTVHIRVILGLNSENGKEHGNCYNIGFGV